MKRKRKKAVRLRGFRTHGWGGGKKHRGKGSQGGKGYAGSKDHKRIWIMKNEPDRLGKRGFHSLMQRRIKPKAKAINLRDLERIAIKKGLKEIDLRELGYGKLLGAGEVTQKLTIKAGKFSASAKEKIEKAGGKIITE